MGQPIREYLEEKYGILQSQPIAHIHLDEEISGLSLIKDTPVKLDLSLIAKHEEFKGGWAYDNALTRFVWESDFDFVPVFAGTASIQMTSGSGAKLTLILRVNGNTDILTTPATFTVIDRIQQFAAVDLTKNGLPYISKDDYVEVWAVSSENATFKIDSFQIILLGR